MLYLLDPFMEFLPKVELSMFYNHRNRIHWNNDA